VTKKGVLQLVDSLASGGAEHVAVMLANNLPMDTCRSYLCASRRTGPLQSELRPEVGFLDLQRKNRFDIAAILKLARFSQQENIQIIHAHTSSLFLGVIVSLINPRIKLVWHDHVGRHEIKSRSRFLYGFFARRASIIFTVSRDLASWAVNTLGLPKERVLYLPNFVEMQQYDSKSLNLPGHRGKRVVCVANVRVQKDHLTLLQAFSKVVKSEPNAHLLLVGGDTDTILAKQARKTSRELNLESNVSWLGPREDVPSILSNCDIGVLSSVSEGFPVVLLEYGQAGLAVVATRVGECAEILEDGEAGILVHPSDPDELADEILHLLNSQDLRVRFGERLAERVKQNFSVETVINQVRQVYERIL
jgi:glycosyltransferase involved in cell wall biosynthesis